MSYYHQILQCEAEIQALLLALKSTKDWLKIKSINKELGVLNKRLWSLKWKHWHVVSSTPYAIGTEPLGLS